MTGAVKWPTVGHRPQEMIGMSFSKSLGDSRIAAPSRIHGINMVLQYKKVGRWADYLFGERAYIILSLTSKSVLAWLIWAGTLAPV